MFKWLYNADVWVGENILRGNKGETISSRLGRLIKRDDCKTCTFFAKVFCHVVLAPLAWALGQGTHHCKKSIQKKYE